MAAKKSKSRASPRRLVRSRARAKRKGASVARPAGVAHATGSLAFSDLLRECLAVGVVLVDSKKNLTSLNSQARTFLGLSL